MTIYTVSSGSNASLDGLYAGRNIVIQGGGTLLQTIDSGGFTNSSGLTISNQSSGRLGILGNSSYALTNAAGALISNAGTIYGNGVLHNDGAIVNNSGTISVAASSIAYGVGSNGAVLVSVNNTQGTVSNAGVISNAGLSRAFLIVGGVLVNQSGGQLQNYAVVGVQSATSGSSSFSYYNSESQSYSYAPVTTATAAGQFANFGTVFNARGAEFNVSGSLTNYNGGTFVNDGSLNVNSLGSVINYGLLAGVGIINGNLTDYGTISGGDVVTHTGNMIFNSGTVTIESGASAANISIGTGGSIQDKSGGTVSNVTVGSGASLTVSSGVAMSNVTVVSGGVIDLLSGASVTSLTMSAGGVEQVGAGEVQTGAVSGLNYAVGSGGKFNGTVSSGATLTVSSGGVVSGAVVAAGGVIQLISGASITALTLNSGAIEQVGQGYVQTGAVSGLNYAVNSGGKFNGTVSSGATLTVSSGGVVSGAVVAVGGVIQLSSGATISNVTVSIGSGVLQSGVTSRIAYRVDSGGTLIVSSGQAMDGVGWKVSTGATEVILSGATGSLGTNQIGATVALGAGVTYRANISANWQVQSGATLVAGNSVAGTTVSSGGTIQLLFGATGAPTLLSGASEQVGSGYIQTGAVSGANYQVLSGGTIVGTVSAGVLVTVSSGGAVSGAAVASGGTVILNGGSATDLNLNQGAVVDFNNVNYAAGETVTVNNGVLQLLNSTGGLLASATLASGTYTGASYTLSQDGDGSARVFVAICYLEGTNILTPKGEVTVESLKAGDTVVTRFGGLQNIRWVGRQSFRGEAIKNDWKSVPVHIRAGALGDGLPSRDLYVSPGHSMLVDGTLLLAKHLVNGITITQRWVPEQVEYYQLDLGAHDCVLAEGTWSETYADAGTLRDEFDNAEDFTARFPNCRAPEEIALCAPRPQKGEALAKGLLSVLARAGELVSGKLRGQVDKVNGGFKVEGWAQDLANPDFPVMLEVLHDGMLLGEVLACEFRPDLLKAGIGRGYSAFTFVSPIRLTAEMHAGLAVRRKADHTALGMNPEITKTAALAAVMPAVTVVATTEPAKSPVSPSQPPQLRVVGNAT